MLRKIISLIRVISFHATRTYKIIIFDDYSQKLLCEILDLQTNYPNEILGLNTRNQKIFINFKILLYFVIYLTNNPLRLSYYLAFLKCFKPKVVITFNPLDKNFDLLIQKYPLAKFISISNGPMIRGYPQNITNRVYDIFYATNYFQQTLLSDHGSLFQKCEILGPFLNSYFLKNIESKISNENEFDICLISQFEGVVDEAKFCSGFNDAVRAPAIILGQFLKQNPELKVVVAMRSNQVHGAEEEFFRQHLGEKAILSTNYQGDPFASYKLLLKSKVVVGGFSTLCLESLDLGRKTFLINYTLPELFQITSGWKFTLNENSLILFSQLFNELISLSESEYENLLLSTNQWKFNSRHQKLACDIIKEDIKKILA